MLLFGGPTIHSLVKEPSPQPKVVAHLSASSNRSPASLDESIGSKPAPVAVSSPTLIEFGCKSKGEVVQEVDSGHIRITGTTCRPVEKLTVMNKTNGFSASVIFTKNKKFTTDFIDLKEGNNSFEITSTEKDGSQQIRVMNVVRRVPANIEK